MTETPTVPHVLIHYTDTFSPHTQKITTRPPVSPVPGAVPNYEAWDSSPVSANVMVEALITAQLSNVLPMTTFVSYDVFAAPDPELPPQWLYTAFVAAQVGTLVNAGTFKAVSYTMSFRTSTGGLLKVVNLNTPVGNVFGNVYGLSARDADIAAEILDPGNAWAGVSGGQPLAFSNITVSLNKRLRRKYDMI